MPETKLDFEGLGAALLARTPDLLNEWLPGGRMVGREYTCGDIQGGEGESFKVNISTGKWADFSRDDKGGDLISLYALKQGIKQGEAAKILADQVGFQIGNGKEAPRPTEPKPAPPPEGEKPPTMEHRTHGAPQEHWVYRDGKGEPLFYIARYETAGGKEFCPWSWVGGRWRQKGWPAPRPLYGLEILGARPNAPVLVVEGEKAADAARLLAPIYAVVTWPNGAKSAGRTYWEPLKGRTVLIWPDADKPGVEVAEQIAAALVEICPSVKVLYPGENLKDGWDAADAVAEGWDWHQFLAWAKPRAKVWPQPAPKEAAAPPAESEKPAGKKDPMPFQVLGYNQGSYYYLPQGARQVVELRADSHGKLNLLRLAPLWWWAQEYASKMGTAWVLAADNLMRKCERVGIYDPERIRGRGAWWDVDQAVLHLGDILIKGGERQPIMDVEPGKFIYQAAPSIALKQSEPLVIAESRKLLEVCSLIAWEKPLYARLLAGWVVIAPICGALSWRPHIWLTGPAGCGKTWIIDRIIRQLVGPIGIAVQGETTEAGIRQTLGHDARPIIFDEADGETERAHLRIQNTLALMRGSSSETGAVILKGSIGGAPKSFRIRSCFAFGSVGVGVQQYADATRVSVLSIIKDGDRDRFKRLLALVTDLVTPEFTARLLARSFALIPSIRANAERFTAASAVAIGSQRLGDQVGALVAGAYSLHSDEIVTEKEAQAWVESQDWEEEKAVQETTDELGCLQHLLSHVVRVQTNDRAHDRTIDELLVIAAGDCGLNFVKQDHAIPALMRLGFRVDGEEFTIANSHPAIARILQGTPWSRNWSRVLKRLDGAKTTKDPVRFLGARSRGVILPLSYQGSLPPGVEPEGPPQDDPPML